MLATDTVPVPVRSTSSEVIAKSSVRITPPDSASVAPSREKRSVPRSPRVSTAERALVSR